MKLFILSVMVLLAWPLPGLAEHYKYRDENGVLRFSDNLPEKYTGQVKIYQEIVSAPETDSKQQETGKSVSPVPLPPQPKTPEKQIETKFTLLKNRILLPVEIVGTRGRAKVQLVMDTGAQRTFLWRAAMPSIGLRKIGRVRAAGITGSKYASSVRAKAINVGPYRIQNAEVAVMDPGRYQKNYDGLLGMDFLMKVRYEIDYKRRVVVWKGLN